MILRTLQDWKPLRWFPLIETRVTGVFLTTAPNVQFDMRPQFTEWRFRAALRQKEE